jgi:DNA-binding NtrC family response regulator
MPRAAKAGFVSTNAANPVLWSSSHNFESPARPTLLWIDDFVPALELYQASFERLGFRVLTASNGELGVALAATNHVDVVVTDYEMPGINGEDVATAVKAINTKIPVIMFSGSTLIPLRLRRVVDAFCDKAGSRDKLLAVIHRLLHKKGVRTLQPPPVAQASHHGHRTVA